MTVTRPTPPSDARLRAMARQVHRAQVERDSAWLHELCAAALALPPERRVVMLSLATGANYPLPDPDKVRT